MKDSSKQFCGIPIVRTGTKYQTKDGFAAIKNGIKVRQDKTEFTVGGKPKWLRAHLPVGNKFSFIRQTVRDHRLSTVCEESMCPNIGECWSKRHATMMVMGNICTRACAFCNVSTGKPSPLDPLEPMNVAIAVAKLRLKHVVITSVDRDDLPDGGAGHFVTLIQCLRDTAPDTTIEILTPDFLRKEGAIETVASARPDVFNHNLETIPRLYPSIRPGARYFTSLG